MNSDVPSIPLDDIIWQYIGSEEYPDSRLLAHILIAGVDMHLEAIEVNEAHEAVDPLYDDRIERLVGLEDTLFTTLKIEGREFVIWATPYGT